jgi:hypothetical protein
MSSAHIIFIPAVLAVGIFIGFLLGSRVAQDRINLELKRQAERDEARRKRAERKAGQAEQPASGTEASASGTEADTVKAKKGPPR